MKKIVLVTLICSVAAFAAVNLGACKGCHGSNFDKVALGKSKVVSEMTKKEVSDALKGYKAGSYGGSMKGMMKNQVAKYSDEELESTGIGTGDSLTKLSVDEKKSFKVTNVLFQEDDMFAYKEKDTCWVVDFQNKKSNSVECNVVVSRTELKDKGFLPPVMPDMPSALFQGLFK